MVSPHLLALLAITTAITSISAAPAPAHQSSPKDLLLSGLPKGIDPAKLIPERPGLQKRGRDQNYFRSALPGCSDDDDPSYAIGNSAYQDGKGMLSDSGMCDNKKYTGGWHCWTDMHYGMVQIEYSDGTNTGGTIDFSAWRPSWMRSSKPSGVWGGGFSWTPNVDNSDTTLTCNSVADQGSCQWDDEGCHGVWKGKRNKRVSGYMRRSCDKGRDGTNMNHQRPDGYWTVGMLDFDYLVPDNQLIGCAALYNDVSYPEAKPGGPSEKVPSTTDSYATTPSSLSHGFNFSHPSKRPSPNRQTTDSRPNMPPACPATVTREPLILSEISTSRSSARSHPSIPATFSASPDQNPVPGELERFRISREMAP
ncbi:hypothetical protein EYC84_003109 [Monilinia fructicola]|uniref:Uncharacterized protein n=1 Tax=Monilinia fructicola TaxID=38448 RepID=A0A5M9JWK1_MONFR|nr:hypothetical protein EYC84_003109 [Monilinia fructicola]